MPANPFKAVVTVVKNVSCFFCLALLPTQPFSCFASDYSSQNTGIFSILPKFSDKLIDMKNIVSGGSRHSKVKCDENKA